MKTRAIVVKETGGPEKMQLEQQDLAAPGAGQVQIKVAACGVNFIDTYFRSGLYPRPLPFVNGMEGGGTIEAVGEGVSDLKIGDKVAWSAIPGSYADRILAIPAQLIAIPSGVSEEQAAASMLQGMTAHYLAHGVRQTAPGDIALVHAAAGGTGLVLVQTLKRAGATVYGTCSTTEKEDLARGAGADEVIRYDQVDFAERARDLTKGRGVDVVYDGVGKTTFEGSLKSLKVRGLLALFGQASGPVPPFDLNRLNDHGSLFVTRPSLIHYIAAREEYVERASAVLSAVAEGALNIRVGAQYPLAEATKAHRALEGRKTTGKLLLIP